MNQSLLANQERNALYGFENGIPRMLADLEAYISPFYIDFQPLFFVLSKVAFLIIPLVALGILFYLVFIKKRRLVDKLTKKHLLIYAGALILYFGLSFCTINFGYGFNINFSALVLPCIAKVFGPYISGLFAIIQYISLSAIYATHFNFLSMIVAAIGGMLYGFYFYGKRSSYSRCLIAKLVIGIICNLFLNTIVIHTSNATELTKTLTATTIDMLFSSPIQALLLYLLFRLNRVVKKHLSSYK